MTSGNDTQGALILLDRQAIPGVEAVPDLDELGWSSERVEDEGPWRLRLTSRHGEGVIAAAPGMPPPPPFFYMHDPRLSGRDVQRLATAKAVVMLALPQPAGDPFVDRKALLRAADRLLGLPGAIGVYDPTSSRMWTPEALELEMAHDADLSIDSLYVVHMVTDDDEPPTPGDDAAPTPIRWLHTHGLSEIGGHDFDILDLHPTFRHELGAVCRGIAFASLEGGLAPEAGGHEALTGHGPIATAGAPTFMRRAASADRARRDSDDHHEPTRVVFIDPPRRGFLGLGGRPMRGAAFFRRPAPEPMMVGYPVAAGDRLAKRARRTFGVFAGLHDAFEASRMGFLVKLGIDTDRGDGLEHMWFDVHAIEGDQIDATLLNQPIDVASLKEGQRGRFPLSRLTEWTIFTPVGRVTAEEMGLIPFLRAHRGEILGASSN